MGQVNLGTAEGRIVIDGSGATTGFGVATSAAEAFFNVVADRVHEIQNIGKELTKIGAITAGGFGLAVNAAAGFEERLSAIKAVSGATGEQMAAVSKKALQLGADTKFSASEAANAIEELVKAGVSVEDALNGAADATTALAAAGEVDLPRAAEISANAMNVFNLAAKDMPHVADLIAGAANASAIDVEQFAQSLQASGAAANLAGFSFDDLSQAIALMGNAGIKGSDAGTSLKTMLLNLNPVTDKQKGLMEELGLITKKGGNQFFDAAGNVKSFADVAQTLQDALKGQTKQQKLATLETLFGSDAIRAAAVVSDAGAKGFTDMADAMGKVTAQGVAATRMDNLRGSIEQLKGSVETAAIIIGKVFLPALKRIVDFITRIVNVFANAPAGVQKFLTIVVALGGGLSLLTGIMISLLGVLLPLLARFLGLVALKQVFSIFAVGFKALRGGAGLIGSLAAVGGRAVTVFGRFGKIIRFLFVAIRSLFGAVGILRVAVGALFGPWGIAIAAVIALAVLLFKKWQPFHDLVIRIANAIKGGFSKALQVARTNLALLIAGFKGISTGPATVFERIGAAARILWNALVDLGRAFMQNVVPALKSAGADIWNKLKDVWAQMSAVVQGQLWPALQQLWTALAPFRSILAQFGGVILKVVGALLLFALALAGGAILLLIKFAALIATTVLPPLIKFVAFLIGGVVVAFGAIASVIVPVITAIVGFATAIGAFIGKIITFFTGAKNASSDSVTGIRAVWASIVGFFVGIWNGIKAIFFAALAAIKALWTAFWSSQLGQVLLNAFGLIGDILKLAWAAIRFVFLAGVAFIKAIWSAFWNGLKAVVSAALGAIVAFVAPRIARIKAVISAAWNAIKAVTAAAWAAVKARILAPIAAAAAAVYARTAGIRARVSAAWNAVKTATTAAWNRVVTAVKSAVDRLLAVVTGIKDKVVSAVKGAGTWLYNAGKAIIQGLLDGINSMISTVRSKLQTLTNLIPKSKGPPTKDKKLLYDNGVLIMEGLIRGISDQFHPFQKTLQGLTTSIPVTAMANVSSSPVPKIVLPRQAAPQFPSKMTLQVGGREFDAYVVSKADGVMGAAAAKIGRGRK